MNLLVKIEDFSSGSVQQKFRREKSIFNLRKNWVINVDEAVVRLNKVGNIIVKHEHDSIIRVKFMRNVRISKFCTLLIEFKVL